MKISMKYDEKANVWSFVVWFCCFSYCDFVYQFCPKQTSQQTQSTVTVISTTPHLIMIKYDKNKSISDEVIIRAVLC